MTSHNIILRAPALPQPTQDYDRASADQLNNILRIYFNQVDEAFRNAETEHNYSETLTWFMS